ncbi:dTDP-4-dehydrorhamnose reductase [soil metagenome]
MSRILLLGSRGRVGAALVRQWSKTHDVKGLARPEIDVADLSSLGDLLQAETYDVLVNATGLTNVDRCETDQKEALTVNTAAPEIMAAYAAAHGARFIHFSTDYVFDGLKETPYTEKDPARPLSIYGQSKLAGEVATLSASLRHLVIRVSWVFGYDKPSFVDMLVQRALANDRVEAIGDKTSSPTFAEDIAGWLDPFLASDRPGGLFHACNSGACTWQQYGQHALDCALQAGLPLKARSVDAIPLDSMKAFLAARPRHTAMDTAKLTAITGQPPRPWQDALAEYFTNQPK